MTFVLPGLIILALIAVNALFVTAEFALIGAKRSRVERLAREGHGAARRIRAVLADPHAQDLYFAVVQLGITLASIGLGMYGEVTLTRWLLLLLEQAGTLGEVLAHVIAVALAVALLTYLHVTLGEMVPKALALQAPERTALRVETPIRLLGRVFYPVVVTLNAIGNALLRLLRVPLSEAEQAYSADELELIVAESSREGTVSTAQQTLIGNIFDFSERDVRQLMTPRPRVVGLPLESSTEDVRAFIKTQDYSRIPIYESDLDHIIGVLHVKDFIRQQTRREPFALRALLRHAPYVPEQMSAERLFATLKRLKVHMAVVTDEYGGVSGIITQDDLIEEIMGPLESVRQTSEVVEPGVLRLPGEMLLEEANERFGLNLTSRSVDTLAGLLLEKLERIPQVGDHVTAQGVRLEAEALDGLAVSRVRLRLPKIPDAAEEQQSDA